MRFAAVEDWSLRDSVLHRRDARAKIIATLVILMLIGRGARLMPAAFLAAGLALSKAPLGGLLARACVILPFSGVFAVVLLLSNQVEAAVALTIRSVLSTITVLLLMSVTPLPALLDGFRRLGVPPVLLEVIQFVYSYLFLVAEQAQRMALAATARGARRSFTAVAGSVGVLFARSYDRAEAVHRSMLARGYSGSLPRRTRARFDFSDLALVTASGAAFAASFLWA